MRCGLESASANGPEMVNLNETFEKACCRSSCQVEAIDFCTKSLTGSVVPSTYSQTLSTTIGTLCLVLGESFMSAVTRGFALIEV